MAWTAPRTWTTGELVTAAMMNTHVRDNDAYLKGRFNWLTTSIQSISDLNRTATLAYTNLDLTATTSATARFAFLNLNMNVDSSTNGIAYVRVRRKGDTPTYMPGLYVDGELYENASLHSTEAFVICGLDTGQILEYTIVIAGTIQVDTTINLLGYIDG